jgi:outer membrane usher protein
VNFAQPTDTFADNRFNYEIEAEVSQTLGSSQAIALSARYSHGRGTNLSDFTARARYNYFKSDSFTVNAEALYEDRPRFGIRHSFGFRINANIRLGAHSRATAQYDSRGKSESVGFETNGGEGVGAWTAGGVVSHSPNGTGLDASASYVANRALIGLSHSTQFGSATATSTVQRTALRLGTAMVLADGHFALSRPINDSFALAVPHSTLKGHSVVVEPRKNGHFLGESGILGGAVDPSLTSYFERVVSYDVPDAPTGYDLGSGNIRIKPPYRSGYLITAGSEYSVNLTGTLFNSEHEAISLMSGTAIELDRLERAPLTVFTNRAGRFAIQGMRPGRWKIEFPGSKPMIAVIEVPAKAEGLVMMGEVTLMPQDEQGVKP